MEKPLHVQVAEALGWTVVHEAEGSCLHAISPDPAERHDRPYGQCIPRFDESWAATGPLIEKYGITLVALPGGWLAEDKKQEADVFGDKPLETVCNLLLSLHRSGKLGE